MLPLREEGRTGAAWGFAAREICSPGNSQSGEMLSVELAVSKAPLAAAALDHSLLREPFSYPKVSIKQIIPKELHRCDVLILLVGLLLKGRITSHCERERDPPSDKQNRARMRARQRSNQTRRTIVQSALTPCRTLAPKHHLIVPPSAVRSLLRRG